MQVQITLNDDNGGKVLVLTNCHQPELIDITFHEDVEFENSVQVSIEDLKLALRKLATK